MVAQRDKARKELFDSIDLFCQEVDLIPLQERENSLQVGNISWTEWSSLVSILAVVGNLALSWCHPRKVYMVTKYSVPYLGKDLSANIWGQKRRYMQLYFYAHFTSHSLAKNNWQPLHVCKEETITMLEPCMDVFFLKYAAWNEMNLFTT